MSPTRHFEHHPGYRRDHPSGHAPHYQLRAMLGPTNTGKTHFAIERMLAHNTGMIGLPLRLLAREVYQSVSARVGEHAVALITGEERILPPGARYFIATTEAMPQRLPVDFVAIDEIQTATDFERGHVFTDRILNARGKNETLLLGAATMAPIIRALLPGIEIIERPRLSQLLYAGSKKITRLPPRSAIIAFSVREVYAIAELVRRERGGAAVVMGALSPRTRNAQVALYQNGDVDFLIATDAIGMGLNLDISHVAFSSDTKFDGHQTRPLTPAEMGQIAGRAGRHTTDGTFGVTGHAPLLDEEMVERLQEHVFDPVRMLQWRNSILDFSSPQNLMASLDQTPVPPKSGERAKLTRAPTATDHRVLQTLIKNGAAGLAVEEKSVRLLWECCQIPDYRDISLNSHIDIITSIFSDLRRNNIISNDWIEQQVRFCDNVDGDIDTLSNRIKQIRTWTFVANRKNWLNDPHDWRKKTREIENRLSDALHERLTKRFVDKRTSVLIRHLRDKTMTNPEINDKSEVHLEGHLIGSIKGFRFALAKSEGGTDAKGLRAGASAVIAPEIRNRAIRLAAAPNDQIILSSDGFLRWKGEIIAQLAEGDDLFSPRIIVLADESLSGVELDNVQERLAIWLRHAINTQLEPILALRDPKDIDGAARGILFQLSENFGILQRRHVAREVRGLDQDERGKMRRFGVRFGAYHIYLPQTLKPAPRELSLILYALKHGGLGQPGVSHIPSIVLSGRTSFEIDPAVNRSLYEIAGFKVADRRAVRVDILERLADIIRPLISFDTTHKKEDAPEGAAERNGFRVTVEMTSLLGCAGDDFSAILKSLGYRLERTPLPPKEAKPETPILGADPVIVEELAGAAALDGVEAPAPMDAKPANAGSTDTSPADTSFADTSPAGRDDTGEILNTDPNDGTLEMLAELDGLEANRAAARTRETPATKPEESKESKEPEEPRFDEVWFPGSRRSHNGDHKQPGAAPQNRERQNRPQHTKPQKQKDRRPEAGNRHKGKGSDGSHHKQPHKAQQHRPREKPREKPMDPDSPFAALAALKNKLPKK